MTSTIVSARPEHVEAIHAMVRQLAEYEKLTHLVTGTRDDLERELFGERSVIEAVVALENAAPVGFALFFHNFSTFLGRKGLYLEDIYVRPQHRRHGHGRALLARLANIAVERGCGRFEWSVLDWNTPSIKFYESLGATVLADWRIVRVTGEALRRLSAQRA